MPRRSPSADASSGSAPRYSVEVEAVSEFLPEQSDVDNQRFVFAYHITLRNTGAVTARLLTRHWVITDANQEEQEVHGDGVVGEHPTLAPGQTFSYTSAAVLQTEVGAMRGSYQMLAEDGTCFDAPIPVFTLAPPLALH